MLRVGTANVQPRSAPQWVAFLDRMAALGYVEGRNFIYDHVQVPNEQAWEASYRDVVARQPDPTLRSSLYFRRQWNHREPSAFPRLG
jgi:hypothetical protein